MLDYLINRELSIVSSLICSITNVSTVTFYRIKASLLNSSINFLQKKYWSYT